MSALLGQALSLQSPLDPPLHFTLLEFVVYACFVLTARHAWTRYKAGDTRHLFQWVVLFIYGVIMELVSFNLFQNYAHGTFSVQLYHGQLPLYITCIYMVFHYTGIKMVERLGLTWGKEALLCGLAIVCIDVPYDTLGVDTGWWRWVDDPEAALHPRFIEAVRTRWLGVPVSSYYWYLMYGALAALFCRAAHARLERKNVSFGKQLMWAPLVSIAVVVCGALAFELMFWLPRNLGLSDDLIVATYFAAMLVLATTVVAPLAVPSDRWVVAIVAIFHGFQLSLLAWLWATGGLSYAPLKLVALVSAAVVSLTLALKLPLRRAQDIETADPPSLP